ncbi:MAG: hypothetical protein IJ699_07940 [Bacteroidaceae bacterium]|nr:hypothetical protein [Bacteroidaceae bacterium]
MSSPLPPRDLRDIPQMHQRSMHHDYHGRGIYLVTLCTEGRRPLLGKLVGGSLEEAAVEPSALGNEVLRCWNQIPDIQRHLAEQKAAKSGAPCNRDIRLLDCQLMPDHFHGIIFIRQDMDIALGDVIRGFMVGCTKAFNGKMNAIQQLEKEAAASKAASLAASKAASKAASLAASKAASKAASLAASPQICGAPNRSNLGGQGEGSAQGNTQAGPGSAQGGIQARPGSLQGGIQAGPGGPQGNTQAGPGSAQGGILVDDGLSVGCSAYSRDLGQRGSAPLRPLWEKGFHDRLLQHEGQLQNMIDYVRDNPRRLMLRRQHSSLFVVQHQVRYGRWSFSSVGQLRLLDAPLVAVHVRRYFTLDQRRDYMNGCILAARRGAVLVSPFISEHEKRVRDEAFREGLCCIQLCNEPFSDYYKPAGELITPCTDGRLLLLTLVTGAPQERRITRDECTSLNAVAESMARQSNDYP